jgi:DNA-binding NarL/FixJ family response regulator
MDVLMPELDGIESTRRIKQNYPDTGVIALSMYADKHFISEMFKAGAKGFLLKDCASTELVEAVYTVRKGDTYLGPSISDIVAKMYVDNISCQREKSPVSAQQLTSREIEITRLLAEGLTNNEVASLLHVSVKTVGSHRQNIMRKLGLRNIAELTKYAINKGLISLTN